MKTIYIFSLVIITFVARPALPQADSKNVQTINQIVEALQAGATNEASTMFESLESVSPADAALINVKLGRASEALAAIEELIELSTTNRTDVSLRSLILLQDLPNTNDTVAACEQISERFGIDNEVAYFILGSYGKLAMDVDELTKRGLLIGKNPQYRRLARDLQYKQAMRLYQKRRPEALDVYASLFEIDPELQFDPGYKMQHAHILTANGRGGESLLLLDEIQKDNPVYVEANQTVFTLAKAQAVHNVAGSEKSEAIFREVVNKSPKGDDYRKIAEDTIAAIAAVKEQPAAKDQYTRLFAFVGLHLIAFSALGSVYWVRSKNHQKVTPTH